MSVPDPSQTEKRTAGQPAAKPLRPMPGSGAARPIPARSGQPVPLQPGGGPSATRPIPVSTPKPSPLAVEDDEAKDDEEGEEFDVSSLLGNSPPWLVSLVFHLALLIILGLITFAAMQDPALTLKLDTKEDIWAEDLGEQLEKEVLLSKDNPDEDSIQSDSPLPPVDDPKSAPPDAPPQEDATSATSDLNFPDVGNNLNGRERGRRNDLLGAYGGNRLTEESVMLALEWLARQQKPDGSWSLTGPYSDGGLDENTTAATAMALLAFQGRGVTHLRPKKDEKDKAILKFHRNVARGWAAMLKRLDKEGNFVRESLGHQSLYTHGQATIAICELYGMTRDPKFKEPAERAVSYCLKAQGRDGGWRYLPGAASEYSDVSVTGWYVMALQSARMAKLDVPAKNLNHISKFLDEVAIGGGSQYRYHKTFKTNRAMTAEGLLCRQYLGWKHNDTRLHAGVKYIINHPIKYGATGRNVYYWYYATQVAHHMENPYWHQWNKVMRQVIPENQTTKGKERGSWDPNGDDWGAVGGRLYVTCLSTYMLEVYYRHLPIYQDVF